MKRFLALGVMLLLATPNLLDRTAYAGEKFVLKATLYRAKGEVLEVGDEEGYRVGISDWVGVTFNEAGGGFLDKAQYVAKSASGGNKQARSYSGYKIFTLQDGSKAFARYEATHPDGLEGTFQFMSGTGKLAGLRGGGTWRMSQVAPGLFWDRLEGEYEVKK